MFRFSLARVLGLVMLVSVASAAVAQTPPRVTACDTTAAIVTRAPEIYGVRRASLTQACPAFALAAWRFYDSLIAPQRVPGAESLWLQFAGRRPTRLDGSPFDTPAVPTPPTPPPTPQPQPTPTPAPDPAGVLLSFANGQWSNPARVVSAGPIVEWQGARAIRMQQFTELRWDGLPASREVYITAEIWIPTSYQPTDRNDKLFRVWGGAYEEGLNDIKVGASSWGNDVGVEYHWSAWPTSEFWGIGQGHWQVPNPTAPFFVPANRERWVTLGFRARVATSANNDGVAEIYVDGHRIAGSDRLPNYPPGAGRKPGYTAGYFLGASSYENPKVTGAIYVRRFTISTGGFAK